MLSKSPLCAMLYKFFDFIVLYFLSLYKMEYLLSCRDTDQKFYWELVHICHLTLFCIHYLTSWCSFRLKIVLIVISLLFEFALWICIGYFCRCFKRCACTSFYLEFFTTQGTHWEQAYCREVMAGMARLEL